MRGSLLDGDFLKDTTQEKLAMIFTPEDWEAVLLPYVLIIAKLTIDASFLLIIFVFFFLKKKITIHTAQAGQYYQNLASFWRNLRDLFPLVRTPSSFHSLKILFRHNHLKTHSRSLFVRCKYDFFQPVTSRLFLCSGSIRYSFFDYQINA